MKQRALVWIRFPFSNLQETKARPAVVVSNDAYNATHEDVIICAVTSNLTEAPYKVPLSPEDMEDGDLPLESMIRADKIIQVERSLVDRAFGLIGQRTHEAVVEAIGDLLKPPR